MDGKLIVVLGLLLVAYLAAGAYLFQYLEQKDLTSTSNYSLPALPENFTQILIARYSCLSEDDLRDLVEEVVAAYTNSSLTEHASQHNWDIATAFFFVGTVVTTIGYGTVVPVTRGGRLTTLFYGIIGIPLCLIFLAALGEKLVCLFKKIEKICGHGCHKCERCCHVVRVAALVVVGWVLFLMVPAAIFTVIEGWNYLDSVYFAFVTLSTIGFGDMVISAHQNRGIYRVLTMIWVYLGLSWLSSLLALLADIMRKGFDEGGNQVEERIKQRAKKLVEHVPKIGRQGSQTESSPNAEIPGLHTGQRNGTDVSKHTEDKDNAVIHKVDETLERKEDNKSMQNIYATKV